ncbi:acyltransferase [Pseudidiomarina tainanensis]|uniref:Acyltransferase n=1 Tax=Pseudidiomarina tainanensis TaxID=502365 RepID=A0ACD2HJE1_9GAMM|nr:acyltransferase [Pseudidiomarina tainanensis]RZQ56294.1 acyltransferase [Pseudidiomarina tainanensis]
MKIFLIPVVYFFVLISRYSKFINVSILVSKIPFTLGSAIRYEFYKRTLDSVGEGVLFSYGVIFSHKNIKIGSNVRFGPYNTVGLVDFSDNILIGQYCHFLSGKNQHGFSSKDTPINQQPGVLRKITIANDVWIGTGSIIMESIATGTVVGAGSVISKKFDSYTIVAGNPARKVRER